jgi:hypothetical protein
VAGTRRFKVQSEHVAWEALDDEAVIFNLTSGMYYGLDRVAGLVWLLLDAHYTEDEAADALAERYSIDVGLARADTAAVIDDLLAEELISVDTADPEEHSGGNGRGMAAIPAGPPPEPYRTPIVEKFSDMAGFLALDPPMPSIGDLPDARWD